jgi:diguanylate cyclase (GGDEF)-like protein
VSVIVTYKWAIILPLLAGVGSIALSGYIFCSFGELHTVILAGCACHICFAWWIGRKYDKVKNEAVKDTLTDAYNRRMAHGIFKKLKKNAERRGEKVHFLFIDVNHFKQINDSCGHHVGDQILSDLSGLLRSCFRERAEVFRWGGDEFLVMMASSETSMQKACQSLQQKLEALSAKLSLQVTISIGHSVYPDEGESMCDVVKSADQKMYQKKTMA